MRPLLRVALFMSLALAAFPKLAQALPANFYEEEYVSGLYLPTAMATLPDGRFLVAEKSGKLRLVENKKIAATVVRLSVQDESERGLLGIAIDPSFTSNRYVYLYYTRTSSPIKNRLSRFTMGTDNTIDPATEKILIDNIASDAGNHNGGAVHFGRDGKLYVAVGDGGATSANGQSLAMLSGKILRINKDGSIPPDNPFVSRSGAKKEIWAYGLRNPFSFAFDPSDGRMYINDVGSGAWEEVNKGVKGANYGWPTCEGTCSVAGFRNPLYAYAHGSGSAAITGAVFYRGTVWPASYRGSYFFGDYTKSFMWQLKTNGTVTDFHPKAKSPIDMVIGRDGAMYYLSIGKGKIYRIQYSTSNKPPVASFTASKTSGPTPLTVVFDASKSSDPEGKALTYAWDFGDGTKKTGKKVSHTFTDQGRFSVKLTVRDQLQLSGSSRKTIQAGNPPRVTIAAPKKGATFNPGDKIRFSGSATDTEDGTVGKPAFSWSVVLIHNTHFHPFRGPIKSVKSGVFTIPSNAVLEFGMFYRISLTVTDSHGLKTTVNRDLKPASPVADSPFH